MIGDLQMDKLSSYILDTSTNGVSSDTLKDLGQTAAKMYVYKDISLNDAISKLASQHQVNPEQIKRITEFANQETFQIMFKEAYEDGNKYVDFDIADPKQILLGLDKIATKPVQEIYDDFSTPVSILNEDVMDLNKTAEMFPKREQEGEIENPFGNLYRMHDELTKQAEEFKEAVAMNETMLMEVTEKLAEQIKQELLNGGNFVEIGQLLTEAENIDWAKTAMKAVIPKLEKGYFEENPLVNDLAKACKHKTAENYMPNLSHPIANLFKDFVKIRTTHYKLKKAEERLNPIIEKVNNQVSKTLRYENVIAAK